MITAEESKIEDCFRHLFVCVTFSVGICFCLGTKLLERRRSNRSTLASDIREEKKTFLPPSVSYPFGK